MKMSEYLSSFAPNTTRKFFSEIMYNYGMGVDEFENKSLFNRLIEIHRYFGYSMTLDPNLSEKQMKDEITDIFREYESLMLRYPDGVPDLLGQLKAMSNVEKTAWLEKHYTRLINISLCNSLVKGGPLKTISLRDALVARVMSQIELARKYDQDRQEEEEKFWNDTIKNFNREEIIPF